MVSFYVIAHEDDWQLFMNLNAYADLVKSNSKVVFIYTTAGDDGQGATYWQPREEGAKSSVRFPVATLGKLTESSDTAAFNGHTINRWSVNNATSYFLRLPDGNGDGSGFPLYGYQSLHKLHQGTISAITAVDNSATYNGWNDLCRTIQAIIESEISDIQSKWINYPDTDTILNPGDHSDHLETGMAVQAMNIPSGLYQVLFVDYATLNDPPDLTGTDLFWKSAMFSAYEEAMYNGSGHSTISESPGSYIGWCLRSARFRIISPTGETQKMTKVLASSLGPNGIPAEKMPPAGRVRT